MQLVSSQGRFSCFRSVVKLRLPLSGLFFLLNFLFFHPIFFLFLKDKNKVVSSSRLTLPFKASPGCLRVCRLHAVFRPVGLLPLQPPRRSPEDEEHGPAGRQRLRGGLHTVSRYATTFPNRRISQTEHVLRRLSSIPAIAGLT